LASALNAIATAPELGTRLDHDTVPDLRRIPLRVTRYHLYYVFSDDLVRVLAVWHSRRGTGPELGNLS